jgi:cytochrome c oxidase subunit 1
MAIVERPSDVLALPSGGAVPTTPLGVFARPRAKTGWRSWVSTVDHKKIGIMYGASALVFLVIGGLEALVIRSQLAAPDQKLLSADLYNQVFTMHGITMIFLVVMPMGAAFMNYLIPLQIGARDVAFPRLNLLSWWLYMGGAAIILIALFSGGGAPDTGWTFYVPFSARTGTNVSLAVFGVFIIGFSSILTGVNFVTTIHRLRAEGMTWNRLPLFVWSLYATAWVQILATPILAITLILILAERLLGTGLFDPAQGGDPIMFQHLFFNLLSGSVNECFVNINESVDRCAVYSNDIIANCNIYTHFG